MYLTKPLSVEDDDSYDLVRLKKDKALGLITLYVKPGLIHRNKDNKSAKEIWDTFKTLFGTMNTTQVNQLETKLSNLKMSDLNTDSKWLFPRLNGTNYHSWVDQIIVLF
jgi:hypothetical protein